MATAFSDLYDFVKNLVGDGDDECSLYSSAMLNSHIRSSILRLQDSAIAENGMSAEFTVDLTSPQILRVVLRAAISILDPLPELFHHKGPVLEVTRRRGREYVDRLIDELVGLDGGKFPVAMDTEFHAIFNSVYRWIADFNSALTP